jgi:hypothetical protein
MKLLPVFDNDMEIFGDGMKRRNHRVLRVATIRALWSGLDGAVNSWLDSHRDTAVADIVVRPQGDVWWVAVIQYYENVKKCP